MMKGDLEENQNRETSGFKKEINKVRKIKCNREGKGLEKAILLLYFLVDINTVF